MSTLTNYFALSMKSLTTLDKNIYTKYTTSYLIFSDTNEQMDYNKESKLALQLKKLSGPIAMYENIIDIMLTFNSLLRQLTIKPELLRRENEKEEHKLTHRSEHALNNYDTVEDILEQEEAMRQLQSDRNAYIQMFVRLDVRSHILSICEILSFLLQIDRTLFDIIQDLCLLDHKSCHISAETYKQRKLVSFCQEHELEKYTTFPYKELENEEEQEQEEEESLSEEEEEEEESSEQYEQRSTLQCNQEHIQEHQVENNLSKSKVINFQNYEESEEGAASHFIKNANSFCTVPSENKESLHLSNLMSAATLHTAASSDTKCSPVCAKRQEQIQISHLDHTLSSTTKHGQKKPPLLDSARTEEERESSHQGNLSHTNLAKSFFKSMFGVYSPCDKKPSKSNNKEGENSFTKENTNIYENNKTFCNFPQSFYNDNGNNNDKNNNSLSTTDENNGSNNTISNSSCSNNNNNNKFRFTEISHENKNQRENVDEMTTKEANVNKKARNYNSHTNNLSLQNKCKNENTSKDSSFVIFTNPHDANDNVNSTDDDVNDSVNNYKTTKNERKMKKEKEEVENGRSLIAKLTAQCH